MLANLLRLMKTLVKWWFQYWEFLRFEVFIGRRNSCLPFFWIQILVVTSYRAVNHWNSEVPSSLCSLTPYSKLSINLHFSRVSFVLFTLFCSLFVFFQKNMLFSQNLYGELIFYKQLFVPGMRNQRYQKRYRSLFSKNAPLNKRMSTEETGAWNRCCSAPTLNLVPPVRPHRGTGFVVREPIKTRIL